MISLGLLAAGQVLDAWNLIDEGDGHFRRPIPRFVRAIGLPLETEAVKNLLLKQIIDLLQINADVIGHRIGLRLLFRPEETGKNHLLQQRHDVAQLRDRRRSSLVQRNILIIGQTGGRKQVHVLPNSF